MSTIWIPETLGCTGLELYANRCGLLHTYSSASKLSRKNKAKKIAFAFGMAQADSLREIIAVRKIDNCAAFHFDTFVGQIVNGFHRFFDELEHDTARACVVVRNGQRLYKMVSIPELDEAVEMLRRLEDHAKELG